jgi:hypothetical protein
MVRKKFIFCSNGISADLAFNSDIKSFWCRSLLVDSHYPHIAVVASVYGRTVVVVALLVIVPRSISSICFVCSM